MTNVVILVHGTWGRSENGWYLPSNESDSFTYKLTEALKANGLIDPKLIPYEWVHDNNHLQRERGAEGLADKLIEILHNEHEYPNPRFHFIAHSHGGNVVLKAIEIYLIKLKDVAREPLSIKEDITEQCKVILDLYNLRDGNDLLSGDPKLAEMVAELSSMRLKGELDTIFDYGLKLIPRWILKRKLDAVLDRLFSHKAHHRIVNIVTLGTPFYFKEWRISKLSQGVDLITRSINLIIESLNFIILIYIELLIVGGLFSLLPFIPWIGFNPLKWHWAILLLFPLSLTLFFFLSHKDSKTKQASRYNTNIYFNTSKIKSFVNALDNRTLCRTLNVHANYLDEAYLGLSAFPILDPVVDETLRKLGKPRIWNFQRESAPTGVDETSSNENIKLLIRNIINFILSVMLFCAYCTGLLYIYSKIRQIYLNRSVGKIAKTLALGLPKGELDDSSIEVRNLLDLQPFCTYHFDSSKYMTDLLINKDKDTKRYSFLWDDDELNKRISTSILAKYIGAQLTEDKDQQKHILTLEERGKEFFGVTGFRHSMYYENEKVMDVISKFLAFEVASGVELVNSNCNKDN